MEVVILSLLRTWFFYGEEEFYWDWFCVKIGQSCVVICGNIAPGWKHSHSGHQEHMGMYGSKPTVKLSLCACTTGIHFCILVILASLHIIVVAGIFPKKLLLGHIYWKIWRISTCDLVLCAWVVMIKLWLQTRNKNWFTVLMLFWVFQPK